MGWGSLVSSRSFQYSVKIRNLFWPAKTFLNDIKKYSKYLYHEN